MIEAYDELELEDLSQDAQRVLALNDANGTFLVEEPEADKPLGRRIWDYLELDKN
jgi:outer membrane protein assembly factor BamD (BamD/ComL family)